MKHRLLIALGVVAALFCSCSKDDPKPDPDLPVTGVQLPVSSAQSPIAPGSTVTIQGSGFASGDQIWLRPSTSGKAAGDVQAADVRLVEGGISFTAPALDGPHGVLLLRGGQQYPLGTLHFTSEPDEPDEPVSNARLLGTELIETGEDQFELILYSFDPRNGQASRLASLYTGKDSFFEGMVLLPGSNRVYGSLYIYDDTPKENNLTYIDLADNTLHHVPCSLPLAEQDYELY